MEAIANLKKPKFVGRLRWSNDQSFDTTNVRFLAGYSKSYQK